MTSQRLTRYRLQKPITEYVGALVCDVTLDPDPTTYPVDAVEHVTSI